MMKKILSEKFRFLLWSLTLFSFFCIESSYAQLARKSSATSVNGAEISAFDPATNRLFTVAGNAIEYYTLNSAGTLTSPTSIPYGFTVAVGSTAIPNSVAVKNGVLVFGFAIVVDASKVQQPGKVAFYDPTTATYISDVTVGYLPDMIAFSPDGTKILTANEGEPNSYGVVGTSFDPEGSVSIIDIATGIASATVTEASFTSFNSEMATLKAAGVRIYGPNATVAQDLEPEYVTFIDNTTAAVTLQENNAVAIVNIATGTVTNIYPLGLKDHSIAGNGFDASDKDLTSTTGKINIQNWPVKGMYMPDAIASFTSGGNTYFITANEGDSRDYTGFTEEIRVGATTGYTLDPTVFPTASTLKATANLGRLQLTKATGDTDGDGDFDEIHALGARSFTIWNSTFTPVFDSGDQLEQIIATNNAAGFNSDGTSSSFDGRSDNKGPEPEGVVTGTVNGVLYAFVGSERAGDVFMYDITSPTAPVFKQYINTAADLGVEGIIFVPASNSPTGNALVIVSAEVSKTISVYEFTPPSVNVAAGTIACTGATTTVTVSATAGTAPYTGTGTFTVGAGTYSYTVTDANGLTTTASVTISQPATALVASSASQATVDCNSTTATVVVAATGGTAPYTGTGTFTVGAGSYSYTVTDANGCTAVTTGTVTNVADTTNPTIYLKPSALLTGATGPSTTQTPYLQSQSIGGKYTSILSVNDVIGGYKMVGIPDGLGAYDNNNGTFTLLMNHELGNTAGIARAHGSAGAFVSKWIINKSNLAVQSGSDLIQTVNTWNTTSNSFVTGTTAFNRFCSADLPSVSALYNAATGLGTQERIFLTGEESGAEGRAFGHIATGATAGVTYELPYLGKFSWENVVASPASGNKTVVAGTDDTSSNGQVYFYVGTKTNTGTEIDKAGLNNGKLFGVNVTGLASESTSSIPAANTVFTLSDLGFVQNKTGATLNTESVTAGATNFLRPEDGGFDPSNPNDFYFVTTNGFTAPSRMWRLRFNDIANPETGGTITAVLDGTEGQKMLDNMTIDKLGHILLQEDPGGQAHNAKMWQYTIATDALELVGKHDAARFGEVVGSTTTAATLPYNNDEESSGVIDMSDILGPGMFLIDDQAHYTSGLANLTEVVQGGQLLAFFNPASVSATVSTAAQAAISVTSCSATAVALGTPATADNCSVVNLTNNAPTTFPIGTTTVTWTATDASGNTATATQTVTVTTLPAATVDLSVSTSTASETTGTVVTVTATTSAALCFDETIAVDVTGTDITAADYTLSNATITIPAGSTTGSVTFTVVSDNAVEALETAVLTISNPSSGLALGTTTTQNIAISDFAFTLQVLHASDFEGAVEAVQDAPRFAAIVDKLEDSFANTIKLSSGDNYIPGPFLSSGEDSSLSAALKTSYESYYNTTFTSAVNLLPSIGRADISIMNFIGIEASALGNHEFDLGTNEVKNIIRGANNSGATTRTWFGAQFPYLSSNLNFSGDSNLSAIATIDRLLPNTAFQSNPTETVTAITNKLKLAPSTIIMKGGQKIGVVGATTQVLASISTPGSTTVVGGGANDMNILAGIIQPVVNSLIAEGCNKIILLSHLQQIDFEKELAGKLTGVDIIMAGGSNTLMADANDRLRAGDVVAESYPFLTTGLDGKTLALINTEGNYKYVGRLVVDFDADGTLIPSSIDSLISGVYAADEQGLNDVWGANVTNAYAVGTRGYQVQLLCNAIGSVIIAKDGNLFGKTSVFLEGRRNIVRTEETNLGNITAEANLWMAKFYDSTTIISIKNGGGIRSAIGNVIAVGDDVTYAPPIANPSAGKQSGDISQLDIENSLRFNNKLSLMTLTASGLRAVLEHAVKATTATATPGQFAQVAGVRYSYDFSLTAGSRILNAVVTDANGNIIDTLVVNGVTQGDLTRTFRVVTLTFLAGGGDSYPFNTLGTSRSDLDTVSELGPAMASFTTAGSEQDAFAEYMKNQFSTTPYGIADTSLAQDFRIQSILARTDNVLPPSAGTNGSLVICNGTIVIESQLFAALGGTPVTGGSWSPTLEGSGVYTYTITSPSGSASATVTVTEQALPNAGTSGTLSVTTGTTPTNAQLFAALTGTPDAGGTWTNSGLVYTYTVAAIAPCTLAATATVTVTETIPTTMSFCQGAKVSDAVGTTTLKFYTAQTGTAAPLASTVALTTKIYYATQGTTVSPRVAVAITVNALPATPTVLALTNDAAVLPATSTTLITAVGVYVGSEISLKLTATAALASSYVWTLPAGVTLANGTTTGVVTSTENTINVLLSASVATSSLVVSVKSVNANGCNSLAKTLTLTRASSVAPTSLKMNNGLNLTAITTFAKYMGTNTVLRLTAAVSATATSYVWELPTGVTRVTGLNDLKDIASTESTLPEIFVTFKEVTSSDIFNYTTTAAVPVSTNVLRIGVYGKNGTGLSTTVNAALLNPTTDSTARLLTLTAVKPAAPTALKLNNGSNLTAITVISKLIGQGGVYRLSATVPTTTQANRFTWELPECVTRVTDLEGLTTDNSLTSTNPEIFVKFTENATALPGSIYFGVKAVNDIDSSFTNNSASTVIPATTSTAKLLKLVTAVPAAPSTLALNEPSQVTAVTVITNYLFEDNEFTLTAATSVLGNSYIWYLQDGVNVTSGNTIQVEPNTYTSTSNVITVNFQNVPHENAAFSLVLGVKAVNSVGSSVTVNTGANIARTDKLLTLTAAPPVAVGTVGGSLKICATTASSVAYTIAAVPAKATRYYIVVEGCETCTITAGGKTSLSGSGLVIPAVANAIFTVTYPAGFEVSTTDFPLKRILIASENNVGYALKFLTLTNVSAICGGRIAPEESAVANEFSVVAYPNPSSSEFTIETSAKGAINAKVYDMQGRLVENANTTKVGSSLAPGIYNVIVSQGANTKSVRVIKK